MYTNSKLAKIRADDLTLRQKIGQTGFPGPGEVKSGVIKYGGYDGYFRAYPFCGLYCTSDMVRGDGQKIGSAEELAAILQDADNKIDIPLFVSCDAEEGAKWLFDELHRIPSMMSVGAAGSMELAYKRSYYWAKELRTCGINWPFGPVCDLAGNFFSVNGVRSLSDDPGICVRLLPDIIRGIQDAGLAATAKHFPGHGTDYRDTHFSMSFDKTTMEQWNAAYRKIWEAAVDAGVLSFMTGHAPFPAADDSMARGKARRPASASKKIMDILRDELKFNGVTVTDAVSMKALAAAFEHEDVYIECFNAGNDIILFCHNDYIDVMEKAVKSGRIMMERLDEAVGRILELKAKLGLLDGSFHNNHASGTAGPIDGLDIEEFEKCNYEIGRKAITLINNENGMIPFDTKKVHNVTIINVSPYKPFLDDLAEMKQTFENRGINTVMLEYLKSKSQLEEIANSADIIIYACYLAQASPQGMSFFSRPEDMSTLFNGLSFGAEKSVVASFGATSIYYNYFETADAYLNAYSSDKGTMKAFVDGLLGDFRFSGKSPVALQPLLL